MKLRMYAAVVTGTLAVLLTGMGLFCFTNMAIDKIIFWAVMAYAAGIAAVLWITEPKEEKKEAVSGGDFKVYDLKAGTEFVAKRNEK